MDFSLKPEEVPQVKTSNRNICTEIPVTDSIEIINKIHELEPNSLSGQLPLLWERAENFNVFDPYGNKWIDFSSGVILANVGHRNKQVATNIKNQADINLHNYLFPSNIKYKFLSKLYAIVSKWDYDKIFLLTTGSEAIENAIKLSCNYRNKTKADNSKQIYIVSFQNGFHGRTMGAQLAGGIQAQKHWIPIKTDSFINIPYPDNIFHSADFRDFRRIVETYDISKIACVIIEGYQGGNIGVPPVDYIRELYHWCKTNGILLIFDEVQSGFGRTGKFFSFEHFNIIPDIICCGKGISSSLPLSCILTRKEIADTFPIGSMSSTHSGNPVCLAAGVGVLDELERHNIVQNAQKMGEILQKRLKQLRNKYEIVKIVSGIGLAAGIHIYRNTTPNSELAYRIVEMCFKKGVLICAPVGYMNSVVKLTPPLTIAEDALIEGIDVIEESIQEVIEL
ncbi:MAG: aminotransferase class III-fold pyridoxal phosphate-dependent enzyme [Clostridium sp.]|jgi:4-aminobutyrate aminotransferase-like enzyme|nr:aminotransferase class III-fold pyridoxal phosphate-dependent enzyme [Clostridium sp.]